jgi:acyl-CoA thioester hydrolase
VSVKPYRYASTVEFEDVDSYGIAHHSRLICILERARVHFFQDHGISVHGADFSLVLVKMDLEFLRPARMMDRLDCELTVLSLRAASLVWGYRLLCEKELVLKGQVKMASVGEGVRPVRFPDGVRNVLEAIA